MHETYFKNLYILINGYTVEGDNGFEWNDTAWH